MSKKNVNNYIDGVSKDQLTHGIEEIYKPASKTDEHLEELHRNGFTKFKNVISKKDCIVAKKKINNIYKRQINECGNKSFLESINDQNVVRALFTYDSFFLKFFNLNSINRILDKCFGKKYILNLQNCPMHKARATQYSKAWHRDLSYQHFIPSRHVALSVLFCVDNFTLANGAPYVLPHSHSFEVFPSRKYVKENERQLTANIGDAIVFNALLFHRSGKNKSKNERKVIVQMYTLPFIKQQLDFVKILNGKYSNNKKYSYLFGYDSEVEDSVVNWRKRRKIRFEKNKIQLWKNKK